MTADPAIYVLPQTIRVEECHALDQFIQKHSDQAIQLVGQNVEKFSGLAAQLIVAHQSLRDDSSAIGISDPSPALSEALGILGLSVVLDIEGDAT